ncbi:60S ribosomal protein L21A [Saxophila tyrrhenica]|uniref:60S ribosomal protein L21A n=1 Tax=Saxophila tyrrhenica TaxID=1690608 RepID=A0AAV9NYF1_9PEZI|nr:60S ribosomal protein L21A [Saxophila tyrrhenica]
MVSPSIPIPHRGADPEQFGRSLERQQRLIHRTAFSRSFKKRGMIPLSTYLKQYRVGDVVDVVANGAVQKGMPFKVYHGKTGVVYNVTKSAVGVILYKQVGNRYIEKRVNVRVEHVRHSQSRESFLKRVKSNAAKRREAKENGTQVSLKRLPAQPREARTVSAKENKPESIAPVAYETYI